MFSGKRLEKMGDGKQAVQKMAERSVPPLNIRANIRGDMIEIFKIAKGLTGLDPHDRFRQASQDKMQNKSAKLCMANLG